MKRSKQDRAPGKRSAPQAGPGGQRARGGKLRIDATPEELAAVIGAGPPKAPHEWNYLKRKPVQSNSEAQPQRRSQSRAKPVG